MKDERGFKEVIHSVERSEKDKDKFCKAARIERQPISDARLTTTEYQIDHRKCHHYRDNR